MVGLIFFIAVSVFLIIVGYKNSKKEAKKMADAQRQVELNSLRGRKVLCRKQGELRIEETIYDDIFATADALGMSVEGVKYRVKSETGFKHKNDWYKLSFVL